MNSSFPLLLLTFISCSIFCQFLFFILGLASSCETLLLSEMSVERITPIILNGENGLAHNNTLTGLVTGGHLVRFTSLSNANDRNNSTTTTIQSINSNSKNTNSNSSNKRNSNVESQVPTPESINYKFYVPRYVDIVRLQFNIWTVCDQCPAIKLLVQANALPTTKNYIQRHIIYANKTYQTDMDFYPKQNAWHFIEISFENVNNIEQKYPITINDSVQQRKQFDDEKLLPKKTKIEHKRSNDMRNVSINFGISINFTNEMRIDILNDDENVDEMNTKSLMNQTNDINEFTTTKSYDDDDKDGNGDSIDSLENFNIDDDDDESVREENLNGNVSLPLRNIKYYALLRQTYREFFMFDYDLLPDENGTVPAFINLTAGKPTGFRFDVGNVYDIGGTLSFAIVMKDNLRDATAAAVAAATKSRNHMSTESSATEKVVHVNNGGDAIDSMNYELDHLNVNDDGAVGKDTNTISKNDDNRNNSQSNSKKNNNNSSSNRSSNNNNNNKNDDDNTVGRSNQTIIICMHLGEPGIPTWPDKCVYGHHIYPAASIVNNTNDETSTGLIHVPFPEPGMWYVTLGLYCHGAETAARITIIDSVKEFIKKYVDLLNVMRQPCACANRTQYYQKCIRNEKCLNDLNESETLKVKECLMDSKCTSRHHEMAHKFELHHKFATEQSVATDSSCNTSAVFTVSSSPCVAGRCGRYGRCYHYMSGGFVFSTCLCIKGYRGWDCTEDSQVPSSFSILLALLLLTLSNLLFIPSIYVAMRRKYYTEGVIYFFAMFFSIFYHACDSGEDEYSFCLVKIGVLQFCDFYCGLLAIWVTLIAMAHIRQTFVSLLHMFGAILLAFGTELNKQSLWVFLAPALTGLCLISVSWGWRCQHTRKWFPARKYLSIFLPIGMVLVMIGLICYAFLQTRQNYHIVHSIWHMLMALSILCLLPNRKSFLPKC